MADTSSMNDIIRAGPRVKPRWRVTPATEERQPRPSDPINAAIRRAAGKNEAPATEDETAPKEDTQ